MNSGKVRFLWRRDGARRLIVEVPNPNFERGTLAEGVALFVQLRARLLLVSGHHRCASEVASGCDGTTSVCEANRPYSISDPAHVVEDGFSKVHSRFSELYSDERVISLHGMSGGGLSVSNGTTQPVPQDSFHARLVPSSG
ncbi:MAG: hypothetical protein GY822_01160 [Deltaproteobacteria bacterium]|nr:hypothetical protein [Deltaproteobacteria bacterium]